MSEETPAPAATPAEPKAPAAAPAAPKAAEAKPAPPPKPAADPAFLEEVGKVLGAVAEPDHSGNVPAWRVPAEEVVPAARRLREAGFDYLVFMTAVDHPAQNRIELVYVVARSGDAQHAALLADVERGAPSVETVTTVWKGADWHEREAYDMFGVIFRGHPFLRRILLDEDWPGHPLRKDYVDTIHDVRRRPA